MAEWTPSGTRDVLPDEMRELRALNERLRTVFEGAGYGEIRTPTLENERTFDGDTGAAGPAYRVFDEHGNALVLRADMTVPIARVVGSRYADAEPPLRFCYWQHAYRSARPGSGQSREFLQAGIELLGAAGPAGTVEVLSVLCRALEAAGLREFQIGLGDVSLYATLLAAYGVERPARQRLTQLLSERNFVAVDHELESLDLSPEDLKLLARVPRTRGGAEIFDCDGALAEVLAPMREVHAALAPEIAARVIFDLGLVRSIDYYTGAIFQVYDPGHGQQLGGGGRYDDLLANFGRAMPAVGFALNVELVHIALAAAERRYG